MSDETPSLSRDQLAALQTLFVRLLFCHRTLGAYLDTPAAVLRDYGIPEAASRLLPDVRSDNFAAESYGRKTQVMRAVASQFQQTAAFFERLGAAPRPGIQPLRFEEFLSSGDFLEPGRSLPHPAGVGPGYESISKFYFWMRETYATRRPGVDVELRGALNSDFAAYLMQTRAKPCHPYFDRFQGGVSWRRLPGQEVPVIFVSETLMVVSIGNAAKAAELARIGIVDLDTLEPEPYELEPAI